MKICNDDTCIDDVKRKTGVLEKIKGLMFRESGRALLEFPQQERHGVWMLGMRFPLDLAFIDREKEIVSIKRDIRPMNLDPSTWKIYRPHRMCKYVLEVESGLLDEKGFERGQKLAFR